MPNKEAHGLKKKIRNLVNVKILNLKHFSAISVVSKHKENEIKSLLEFERRKGIVDQTVSVENS